MGLAHGLDDIGVLDRDLALARFDRLPQFIVDDAKFGNLFDDPIRLRIDARDAPSGARVLYIALPIPDQPADVEFVVDDARTALDVPADSRVDPGRAAWPENALVVQSLRHGARGGARGEFLENAANDFRLVLNDLPIAALQFAALVELSDDAIAIGDTAAGFSLLHTATQAAMDLGSQILQKQGVHRAFETDMQLADLAFGKGHDRHARKMQMLEQGGDISLVAADPVQRLGQHHVELAALSVLQQGLDARAQDYAGAGDRRVLIGSNDAPTLPLGLFATDSKLVLDRGVALNVL